MVDGTEEDVVLVRGGAEGFVQATVPHGVEARGSPDDRSELQRQADR